MLYFKYIRCVFCGTHNFFKNTNLLYFKIVFKLIALKIKNISLIEWEPRIHQNCNIKMQLKKINKKSLTFLLF